ncbi:MAG: hypothetical protein WAO08_28915 [Hyphomicrobiaceae bacterium]
MLWLIRFLLVMVTGDFRIGSPEYMSFGLVASFLLDTGLPRRPAWPLGT